MDRLKELAADFAAGTLQGADREEFRDLLACATPEQKEEASRIIDAAALLSLSLPPNQPSASLKAKLMDRVAVPLPTPSLFKFLRQDEGSWIPLKVPGASVKLLSMDEQHEYAIVLGKLDAGAKYPAHSHFGPEQIYVLSGDLNIGEVQLQAGDFHSAAPGSAHGINHSIHGCTILAVLSKRDLTSQFAAS